MAQQPLEIFVPKDHELRIYVPIDEPVANRQRGTGASVRLLGTTGTGGAERVQPVEVFGSPMIPQTRYYLQRGSTVVVFAWADARVELTGSEALLSPKQWWVGGDGMHARPLLEYHALLSDAREAAKERRDSAINAAATEANEKGVPVSKVSIPAFAGGPRVLICGGEGSGKHTAMRTLANYAARQHYPTTLVDLNPSTQTIGLPGSMASCVAEFPLTPSEPNYDLSPSTISYMLGAMAVQPEENVATFNTASTSVAAGPSGNLLGIGGVGGVNPAPKTIHGSAVHYTRLLATRVVERLGPSLTTVEGAYLAPTTAAAYGYASSLASGTTIAVPAAPSTIAKTNAVAAGAIITAPNVRGMDGALYLADVIRFFGITHVLCLGDGQLLTMLQHIFKDEEEEKGLGRPPSMQTHGLSTNVGIGSSAAFGNATSNALASIEGSTNTYRPLNTFAGVRFDFLCPNPAISPRLVDVVEKLSEQRCMSHFHGNGLVRFVPILYRRSHETMSVWQISTKPIDSTGENEKDKDNAASGESSALPPVINLNGKVTSLRYGKKDLTGLAGRLCAIVDLSASSSAASPEAVINNRVVQSTLTNAPILCYAQMREPDPLDASMLVACPENVLDSIPHLAVVVGEFAYTRVYQE